MSLYSKKHAVILLAFLIPSLTARGQAPSIQWGGVQEGIKLGIAVLEGFGVNGGLAIYVAPATNYAKNLVMPELSQALEMVLRDGSNNVVGPKPGATEVGGKELGKPLRTKMPPGLQIRRELRFLGQETAVLGGVKIDDAFFVKETKDYELEVTVRMLKEGGKELVPVIFAPIRVKLYLVANVVGLSPPQK